MAEAAVVKTPSYSQRLDLVTFRYGVSSRDWMVVDCEFETVEASGPAALSG